MVVLKWTNKFSGETGYVKSISNKEKHFVNTFDMNEAHSYSESSVEKIMKNLSSYGELDNNNFEVISL